MIQHKNDAMLANLRLLPARFPVTPPKADPLTITPDWRPVPRCSDPNRTRNRNAPANPYGSRCRARANAIYGLSVHEATGRAYCFNRDYLVLPVSLPPVLVAAAKAAALIRVCGVRHGHGRFLPDGLPNNEDGWTTYWLFDDGCAPRWRVPTVEGEAVASFLKKEPIKGCPVCQQIARRDGRN